MKNLYSVLKSRYHFADKGPYSQNSGFSSSHVQIWELYHKAEHQRIDAFELWCWRRLLRVPWTARRSNQSILKEKWKRRSLSRVWLFATPWTAACQASLSIANSQCLLKLMSIESVMPSNHLIFCHPFLLLPSIFTSIMVFFQWVGSSHQVAKLLELQLQHQSFQWLCKVDFL